MSTHATLSPSKRARWMLCPGSVREEAKYPDDRSGTAAIDGTHTHTLLEWCLSGPDIRDPRDQMGQVMHDDDGEFLVDGQRAMRVQFALDYIMSRKIAINCSAVIAERRVDPAVLYDRTDLAGTVDVQLVGENLLEIIDYKDGMSQVPAQDNPQLEQYLVGVLAPWLAANEPLPYQQFRLTIIQPKLRDKGLPGIDYWDIDHKKVSEIALSIQMQAKATDDPNAPLVPGDKQCQYCRHKGACAALNTQSMTTLGFDPMDVAKQAADKNPQTMSDQQIVEIMEAAPLLRQMIEAVEKEAQRRLEAGQAIGGLKLVRGRGSRAWAYPDVEMVEKLKKFGIPKEAIYITTLVSPAQVEKLVWKKKDGSVKQLSVVQLATMTKEYVTKSDGKLQIALESDSRPAVISSVAGMFAPVETELPAFLQLPDFLK